MLLLSANHQSNMLDHILQPIFFSLFSFPCPLLALSVDVNIWLVTFGFHLHNAIPGFPIPKFDLTQPSLEMKKSQLWDDLPVCIQNKSQMTYSNYPLLY